MPPSEISRPLSGADMIALNPGVLIVTYDELCKFTSIDTLLGPTRSFIVMYMTAENSGHWVCVYTSSSLRFPNDTVLNFFCSYGSPIDSPKIFNGVPMDIMIKKNQIYNFLSELMINSPYKEITYNPFRLQLPTSSACGRFVTCRLWLRELSHVDFYKVATFSGLTPDEMVTCLTQNYLNGIKLSPLSIMCYGKFTEEVE